MEVLCIDKEEIKQALIDDVMVVRGRKLPKFLRVKVENKKSRKREAKTFNKRQLKHS